MGYATNRYFKPAVFTPVITEVEYPYKELFAALDNRQKYEDAAATQTAGVKDVDALDHMVFNNGQFIAINDKEENYRIKSALDAKLSTMASSIAGGEKSSAEYQQAMSPIMAEYNNMYSSNGIFGRRAEAKKNYIEGQKNVEKIEGLQDNPWLTYAWEKNKLEYAKGNVDYLDPNLAKGKLVDRIAETNKIMEGIAGEGSAYAYSDGEYIQRGSNKVVSTEKIQQTFRAGFENSPLKTDMLNEMNYNMEFGNMTEKQAIADFNRKYQALEDMALKRKASDPTRSMSVDPVGIRKGLIDEQTKRRQGMTSHTGATNNIKMSNAQQGLSASTYGVSDSEYQKAKDNARAVPIPMYNFDTPEAKEAINKMLSNFSGSSISILGSNVPNFSGMNSPKPMADFVAAASGYTRKNIDFNYVKNNFRADGIAQVDVNGIGAGATIGTVMLPNGSSIQVAISPSNEQKNSFTASSVLFEPAYGGRKKTYYVPGIDKKGNVDFTNGQEVDEQYIKTYHPPAFYESEGHIKDGEFKALIKEKKINSDGSYTEQEVNGDWITKQQIDQFERTFNVPANQNKYDVSKYLNINSDLE